MDDSCGERVLRASSVRDLTLTPTHQIDGRRVGLHGPEASTHGRRRDVRRYGLPCPATARRWFT